MNKLSTFDFGNINENKKITAKFTKYQVNHNGNETIISALLEEGQLPEWYEGYGVDGEKLLLSLCNLYLKVVDADEWEACHHIIEWCKANSFPYYSEGLKIASYDLAKMQDAERWDFWVNTLSGYEFSLNKIMTDLERLYENTEILLHFYNVKNDLDSDRKLPENKRIQKYSDISSLSEMQLLYKLDDFVLELPKFTFELAIDELGSLRILPGFTSVFDAAYYALARFVSVQSEVSYYDNGKAPLGICESCGDIFFKNGNRQKYCDNPECKKERNRRKSRTAYLKKMQKNS